LFTAGFFLTFYQINAASELNKAMNHEL